MAASTPKIEELRFKLKGDPKSRLFYPLGEELRKVGNLEEAEQVLRAGLGYHPTYLSGWVGLGRILRERGNNQGAVEVLSKALKLDPGNVVAARHLAETYLDLGEKVEAIKKYKLVHALLPADQEVEAIIQRLDDELNPKKLSLSVMSDEEMAAAGSPPAPAGAPEIQPPPPAPPQPPAQTASAARPAVAREPAPAPPSASQTATRDMPFSSAPAFDREPFAGESESPAFDGPAPDSSSSGVTTDLTANEPLPWNDQPMGESLFALAPPSAAPPDPVVQQGPASTAKQGFSWEDDQRAPEAAEIFAAAGEPPVPSSSSAAQGGRSQSSPVPGPGETVTDTFTMAELYARQGLFDDARNVYRRILDRDPQNREARQRLEALPASPSEEASPEDGGARRDRVVKLEQWLKRVKPEGGRV
jgi:tetratricopeptide (TPR) repeat protein